jgi:RND family efflux transporter MFP subunit
MKKAVLKHWTVIAVMIVVGIAVIFYKYHGVVPYSHDAENAATTVAVTTAVVKTEPLIQTLQTNAHITAIHAITIQPKVAGYITKILVTEGQMIHQGQVLFMLDHASETDHLAQDHAAMILAKANYSRSLAIQSTGAVSKEQLQTLHATYLAAKAAYAQSEDALGDKIIKAPFSGSIGAIHLSLGDYVTEASKLTTLTDLLHLRARYALAAKYNPIVHLGQQITLSPTTNARMKQTAKISYKSPTIATNTQTFGVHADFINNRQALSPGEAAIVTQPLSNNPHAIVIPAEALTTALTGNTVYVIEHDHAVQRSVTIGVSTHSGVQILSGLKPGERIILSTGLVRNGARVSWQ